MKLKTALIIEDEIPASERLKRLLETENITVLGQIQSVKKSIEWLNTNSHPDFIFSDIRLSDGEAFEIFNIVKTNAKLIFTTAYDSYAIKAFEVKGLAYLLKPIHTEHLKNAIVNLNEMALIFQNDIKDTSTFESSFLVSFGGKIKKVACEDIVCFFSETNTTYLKTKEGRKYPISKSLEKLETMLNSKLFFRINRSQIVNKEFIALVNKDTIELKYELQLNDAKISRARFKDFKEWF